MNKNTDNHRCSWFCEVHPIRCSGHFQYNHYGIAERRCCRLKVVIDMTVAIPLSTKNIQYSIYPGVVFHEAAEQEHSEINHDSESICFAIYHVQPEFDCHNLCSAR